MGPTTMLAPNAVPISPIPLVRSFGGVRSVTTACAVPMLAANNPASARAAYTTPIVVAAGSTANDTAVPSSEINRTGLRPTRSETQPHTGRKTSCARP